MNGSKKPSRSVAVGTGAERGLCTVFCKAVSGGVGGRNRRPGAYGGVLAAVLAAARASGLDVASFATAAFTGGVPVASITTVMQTKAAYPAALARLGQVLPINPPSSDGGIHHGNHGALGRAQGAVGGYIHRNLLRCRLPASCSGGPGPDARPFLVGARSTNRPPLLPASSTISTCISGGGSCGSRPISPAS